MHALAHELRFVLRGLRRSPAFAITVVLTLMLGVGLNTAIFTVVDSILLQPLSYRDADRIVSLQTHFTAKNYAIPSLGGDDYLDVATQVPSLAETAYFQDFQDGVSLAGRSLYLPVANASSRFGDIMGVQPLAGRLFLDGSEHDHEVLLSEPLARQYFGSPANALNQSVRFGGSLRTVVGVLPAAFTFPGKTAIWFVVPARPENGNRTAYNQRAVGKLRPGRTLAQLDAEMAVLSHRLAATYPEDSDKTLGAVPLQERVVGSVRPILQSLMGAVAVVLLLVCVNITHLQLVRATRLSHSNSVRTALGASRTTLARRALMEAALLALVGCGASVLLAWPVLRLLARLAPPSLPRLTEIHLNWQVLLFSALASLLVMCVTALLPVWRSWHTNPATVLRQDASRGTEGRGALRLRNSLLVVQVALTLTLSLAATLLVRQLLQQAKEDLGFAPEHLFALDSHVIEATSPVDAPAHATPAQLAALKAQYAADMARREVRQRDVLQTVAATPGVLSVSAVMGAPMGYSGPDVSYAVRGKQTFAPPFQNLPIAEIRPVTPGFFSTMHMQLRRGRGFNAGDRTGSPGVVIIDEATARQSFPNENPLGKQLICGLSDEGSWMTIVGVVNSVRLTSPGIGPTPVMYVPFAQFPSLTDDAQLMVRYTGNATLMIDTVQRRLKQTHPELALKASTMRDDIAATQRTDRFRNLLFCSFAAVSLLLAIVGIYGVTSYTVAQRSFEFGLRFALGADRLQVLSLVLRSALQLATLGVAIGIAVSLALARVLAGVVGSLPSFDAAAYLAVSAGLLALATLAALLPARRAARVDPMRMLRTG